MGVWLSKSMPFADFDSHSSSDDVALLFDINNEDAELVITRMHFHSHCTTTREREDSLISSQFSSDVVWIALEVPVPSSCLSKSPKWLLPRLGTLQAAWMDGIRLEKKSLGKYFLTGLLLLNDCLLWKLLTFSLNLGAGNVLILLEYSVGN